MRLTLFDEADLAEFSHSDYPNERLVACRNPLLATERQRKRTELLAATEAALAPIITAVAEGRLKGADKIGARVGKVINRYKMAKHFEVAIGDGGLTVARRQASIGSEAALDGIYVLRTSMGRDELDAHGVVKAYKDLSHVERDFRHIKVDDLGLRPIHHRLEARVRSHVFIAMLGAYLVWQLRQALAAAAHEAACTHNAKGDEVRGFRELLDHLGTLTRNTVRVTTETAEEFEMLSTPTPIQRRVFELLGTAVPLRLR